jgi:hypothetical protein
MKELLTTEQMLNRIQNHPDCQDAVLTNGILKRSYWIACDEDDVWGCDPDGNDIEWKRHEFLSWYENALWGSDYGWESGK